MHPRTRAARECEATCVAHTKKATHADGLNRNGRALRRGLYAGMAEEGAGAVNVSMGKVWARGPPHEFNWTQRNIG